MKSKQQMAQDLRRCIGRVASAAACIVSISLSLPPHSFAESEFSDNASFGRRYTLIGSLELSYDRFWSQGGAGQGSATDNFRQLLLLDQRGYVGDPNLVTYTLSGSVSHESGSDSGSSTISGENLGVTLFHSLPDSWKKNADYIPHPVWLRASRESGPSFESTSYGFSFTHSVSPKREYLVIEKVAKPTGEDADLYEDAPTLTSRIVEKERPFPIPRTFFDYDHYADTSEGSRSQKDILSLRSTLNGHNYDYRFLFEHQNETSSLSYNKNVLQLEPDYRFYDEETRRLIDIRNILRYEGYNQAQNLALGSNVTWSRPIGKDMVSASGAVSYSGSSAPQLTAAYYNAAASGNYRKFLSPRLTNNTILAASITRSDRVDTFGSSTADNHTVRMSDTVSADISRLYNGTASAYTGNSAQGMEYGASAALFSKTRIVTSLTYSYSLSAPQITASTELAQPPPADPSQPGLQTPLTQYSSGRISKHDVTIAASGPLLNNLAFQSRADFFVGEAPVSGGTTTVESGNLSGNLLWRLPDTSVTLGGNYNQSKRTGAEDSTSNSTSLIATLTMALPMGTLFNIYSNWTKSASSGTSSNGASSSELTRLEFRPKLRWTRGRTTVDTEYSYTRSSGGAGGVSVDQRFFVRLVRRFSAML